MPSLKLEATTPGWSAFFGEKIAELERVQIYLTSTLAEMLQEEHENSVCRKSPHGTVIRSLLVHRDDDIALFVSCFDIPVSLDNLFQRIASINDWFDLSRFNQLCEEIQIFTLELW